MRNPSDNQPGLILVVTILVTKLIGAQVATQMTSQTSLASNSSTNLQSPVSDGSQIEGGKIVQTVFEAKGPVFKADYSILAVAEPAATKEPIHPKPPAAISQDLSQLTNATRISTKNTPNESSTILVNTTSTRAETDGITLTSTPSTIPTTAATVTAASSPKPLEPAPEAPLITQQSPILPQQPFCSLGEDTYQIGERWNPNLPPFGVQVCVLCECTVRQRKSCYEAKVACRRITNECPVIDSCPDGKKPVTVAGQCCKSCQSAAPQTNQMAAAQDAAGLQTQQQAQLANAGNRNSPTYESQPQLKQNPTTSFRIVYMNERTKDYMSLVKNLPACPSRDSDSTTKTTTPQQINAATTPPMQAPIQAPKAAKGSRNELNGIDTRLAFKSLQDGAAYIGASSSSKSPKSQPSDTAAASDGRFDHTADAHQHPNDVQSATASNRNQVHLSVSASYASNGLPVRQLASPSNSCRLGNDTFQVGDVWNPILPPFGVQVCVQCNCIFRLRKGCFETKVTCRRINRDCPALEVCPDGQPPINVDGQCCKTCPFSLMAASSADQESTRGTGGSIFKPTTLPLNGIMRNEKVYDDFHTQTRNLNLCVKTRESVDIYNTSRYARRSIRATLRGDGRANN